MPILNTEGHQTGGVDVKTLTSEHFKPKSKKLKHAKHANQRRTTAVAPNEELVRENSIVERNSYMQRHKSGSVVSFDEKSVTAMSLTKQPQSLSKFSHRKLRIRKVLQQQQNSSNNNPPDDS